MPLRLVSLAILLLPAPVLAADALRLDAAGDPLPNGAVVRYGSARLWHPNGVRQLAFSRDGKRLASLGGDPNATVILWDVATGKATARLQSDGLTAIAFAPDGTLYLAANEPTCLVWDPATRQTRPLATVKVKDEVRAGRAVAVSPDGQTVAVGCDKGLIVWLDAGTGKERGRLERREQPEIQTLVYSQSGQTVVVRAGSSDVFVADPVRFRAVRSYFLGRDRMPDCGSLAVSAGGAHLAVSTNEQNVGARVRVFETNSDDEPGGFVPPVAYAHALHFAASGQMLVGFTAESQLCRWNLLTGKQEFNEKLADSGNVVAFDPEGKRLAIADSGGFIRLYDVATAKRLLPVVPTHSIASAAFLTADGKTIVTRDSTGEIGFWERDTGVRRKTIAIPEGPVVSPDGSRLAVWNPERTEVRLLDAVTEKEVWRSPAMQNGNRIAFSPDGRFLAALRAQPSAVEIWDLTTGRRRTMIENDKMGDVRDALMTWSPDGRNVLIMEKLTRQVFLNDDWGGGIVRHRMRIVEQEMGGNISVWEAATGQLRWKGTLPGEFEHPEQLTWSAKGLQLVAIQKRLLATYRIGRVEPLTETMIPPRATAVAVSPDGRWLALGFKNGALQVWEPGGTRRYAAAGHGGAIASLVFSADSARLLSGSEDGTALLWDVAALPMQVAPRPLPPAKLDLNRCWAALAAANGPDALTALDLLSHEPAAAVRLLGERLKPIPLHDVKRVERLILELGDAKFEVRERAQRELAALGEQAEPALRRAAEKAANAETKKRADTLLAALDGPPADREIVRQIRAVELLEHLATPEARALLESLRHGDPAARQTKEAAAALKRGR